MTAYAWPALATLAALALLLWTAIMVARARARHGIMPPVASGPPAFERVMRVQVNTLEQIVIFLPALWLFALFLSAGWAALLGAVWVAARLLYALGYYAEAKKRMAGFAISISVNFVLLVGATIGVVRSLL